MQVHTDINQLPNFKNAAITIGTFDGVHSGHLQIINQLKKEAAENNGESVIITFHPHPRMVLPTKNPNQSPLKLLNTLQEKIELLAKQNVDHLVIVPFTLDFSHQLAEVYISHFLVKKFHPTTVITGYDHRFGKDRKGDYHLLEKYQEAFNYTVKEIPEYVLDHIAISSTKIRQALSVGDISTANESLGYEYFFTGTVVDGNHLGKTLGYPTANIAIENEYKLVPAYGVYAVTVDLCDSLNNSFKAIAHYKGMMNIGIRPTIGDNKIMIEVNIFDFNENIYGRTLRVHVNQFMREEIKFDSLDDLIKQIDQDKINTLKILK
jgi:riboflavin kinase/FMN adenylyltransferase